MEIGKADVDRLHTKLCKDIKKVKRTICKKKKKIKL